MKQKHTTCGCCERNPLHCIIPPYIIEKLLDHKDEKIRRIAIDTLTAGAGFRAVRAALPLPSLSMLGPAFTGGKKREIHDARHTNSLPGALVRSEGGAATGDAAADEAYDGSGDTYDFYKKIHGRDSLDNHGLKLISTVHVGNNFNNAFWNGVQMAYGDGDGLIFQRFTKSLDVIGHELTHGVVSYTANLVYQNEPGAVNEHFADVFGSLVKQWKKKQTVHKANWLIGDTIIVPAPTRKAIRSMANPGTAFVNDPLMGTDPQPKLYSNRYTGAGDNGGVHINSGIPNHAFYLAAKALGGYAWKTVGPIWYEALTTRLTATSNIKALRNATVAIAQTINTTTHNAVKAAWKAVGL